jgi:hypothetical protein
MEYPFGFEGFEDWERAGAHPTQVELQSYCEQSLGFFSEMNQDEYMKIETHVLVCDSCVTVLIRNWLHSLGAKSLNPT